MITDKILGLLFDTGHFHNPKYPTGIVTREQALACSLNSEPVKFATRSYQEFFPEQFDRFALEEHGRLGISDGEIGPATQRLFDMERCGYPDYSIEAANGSGSWPVGCHPNYPNNHVFTVQVNKQNMPSFLSSAFEQTYAMCAEAYRNIGIIFLREDNNNRANTLVTWERGRGWIGLALVPNSPRCGDRIWAKFDTVYRPSDLINQWARLLAHEFGHNMGLSHSRGGIMNPSITSGVFGRDAWRNDPSFPILRRWFGGQPVGPTTTTTTPDFPPEPPSGDLYFLGEFEAMQGAKSLGKFIITPKPQV